MSDRTIFISADHGLAIVYFLQSDVVSTILEAGIKVVVLTDDGLVDQIRQRFCLPGLNIEGLRFDACRKYFQTRNHNLQYWLHFLRWMGGSNRINTNAMDGHMRQMAYETSKGGKLLMPFIRTATTVLRRSRLARQALLKAQLHFTPGIYGDLFEKYHPSAVVASTPGWRWDRFLLREADQRGISTGAAIIGWDNPSSYRLPGASMDWITCWSEIQKSELVHGSDWDAENVNIGGIPTYDGYFLKSYLMPRDEYFQLHGLDPNRKLISYASSFVTFAPNFPNIEALARLVAGDSLSQPSQLLIRLHPNHFMPGSLYEEEARRVRQLIADLPHVHLVEPVPLGGELGYYSGEDMPEKASMMAYSDVFVTVYSTMVVETAIHDCPIIALCLDTPGGWNMPGKFSLKLAEIAEWPTHLRFRQAGAGKVAFTVEQLSASLNAYLQNPRLDSEARRKFVRDEVTFTDGSAGRHTGEFIANQVKRIQ